MSRGRLPAGWVVAAGAALAAHSAVALALLHPAYPPDAPPPALIVEMVAAPPPPPPPGFTVPDSGLPAVEPLVTEPEAPEPEPEPEPEPQVEPPSAEPVVLPDLPPLAPPTPKQFEDAAVPLPSPPSEPEVPEAEPILTASARPQRKPDPPPREEPRQARQEPTPESPRREARREAPRQPQAAPAQSGAAGQEQTRRQSAAPASGAGEAAAPQAMQKWEAKVRQAVARHMSRTRISARGSLTATLAVRVDAAGRVAGVSLAGSSGDTRVDAALSAQARRLPRLPPPPDGRPRDLVVPFRIST